MGVIAERDFILFLKNILNLSAKKADNNVEIEYSNKETDQANNIGENNTFIIENNGIKEKETGYDFYDEEYYVENISNEIKKIVTDEMSNEEIARDNLCDKTKEFMKKKGIYDKWGLLEKFNSILIDEDATNVITRDISDLRDQIYSEYTTRIIKMSREKSEDL